MQKTKVAPAGHNSKLIATLNQSLADAVDLYSQAKQAHWNVRGPTFQQLHLLFDAVATAVDEASDLIAERAQQLGGPAAGTARIAAKHSRLKEYPLDINSGESHVTALSAAVSGFAEYCRSAIDETDELGDKVTADMYTEITRELDKQIWFLESHLDKRK